MKIVASNVPAYIEQSPDYRQAALTKLRDLCLRILTDYEECIEYNVPSYKRGGAVEVAFANQKHYISLYILKSEVVDRHREALAKLHTGKGCIRFLNTARMDFDLVATLLTDTLLSASQPC